MSLALGTRLGPYEILGALGSGGMGEVYRARDARLGREVAIKVLPAGLTSPETRARFDREARAIASLHHPHICTLHDVGREGGQDFLVMEKLEGESLASRLARGPLMPKEAVSLGIQIASALEAAHRAGIVHRDLKPGNVMLTPHGAKLLDFGLARNAALATSPDSGTHSPTASQPLTDERTIVGTFHYMAPEQLEGGEADARSDIHAFGATLYEAIAGKRAFEGKSRASLIAAILKDTPRPLAELQPLTPPALDRVIGVCLAKDPAERWQSAGDLRRELEWISAGESSASGIAVAQPSGRRGVRATVVLGAGAAVVVAIVALVLWRNSGPRLNPAARTRIVETPFKSIEYSGFSRDGRWIALPAQDEHGVWGLYFMNAAGGEVRPVAVDTAFRPYYADISPDGDQIACAGTTSAFRSELRVVSSLGGAWRTLARPGDGARWSPDGSVIGYVVLPWASSRHRFEFWTVRPDGSDRKMVFADSTSQVISWGFAWSPTGREIAWIKSVEPAQYSELVIRDLRTGRERPLTHDHKVIDEVEWTPQNQIIFSSNRGGATNLWMMPARGGRPVQLTRGAGPDEGMRVSADGRTLFYLVRQAVVMVRWWDVVSGETGQVTRDAEPIRLPLAISPDGRQVALQPRSAEPLGQNRPITVVNRDGTDRRTLVAANLRAGAFDWSPDGRRLAWATTNARGDSADLWVTDVGTAEVQSRRVVPVRGRAAYLYWTDPDTLLVADANGTIRYSLSAGAIVDRSADLEFPYARVPGWTTFLRPIGSSAAGVFVRPASGGAERRVVPIDWVCANTFPRDFLYCWPDSLGLSRLDLPSGRLRPLRGVPPKLRKGMIIFPSKDGRVLFWADQYNDSKLVLMEDVIR